MMGRYATYFELADMIRERFTHPTATLRALSLTFVLAILTLTPVYDICPQTRSGGEAAGTYLLDDVEARDIIDYQVGVIRSQWVDAANTARLTDAQIGDVSKIGLRTNVGTFSLQ